MANGHLPRVVGIVGGTGGNTFVRGMMRYNVHVTALCSVCDAGGSTGRLYREFGDWFAQGDIRNCMEAMMPGDKPALKAMFGIMFDNGRSNNAEGLSGHKFGNTAILAAQKWGEEILDSPVEGLRHLCQELGMRGEVLPISADRGTIIADYADGTSLEGEDQIDTRGAKNFDNEIPALVRIRMKKPVFICPQAYEAIVKADLIAIGPGDCFTSWKPSLLATGTADALKESKAKIVLVVNLMTKYGETHNFLVQDFVEALFADTGIGREKIDAILVNNTPIPTEIVTRYFEKERAQVVLPPPPDEKFGGRVKNVIFSDLLSKSSLEKEEPQVRHGSGKLARLLKSLADA